MSNDLEALTIQLEQLARDLPDEIVTGVLTELGVEAKKDIDQSVRIDLGGDNKFSGWRRAVLVSGFEHTAPGQITIQPRQQSQGPFLVAEQGRWPGAKVRGRGTKRRRYAWGPTKGKHTWSDAVSTIEEETPGRALERLSAAVWGRF